MIISYVPLGCIFILELFIYWRTLKTHHLIKCLFMSKIENNHHVKNKIDKFRHLAGIQYENRNAVAYNCRDVAITLRQLKFKKSQGTHTFHYERKKVFEPMFVL